VDDDVLRSERDQIKEAILSLERLALGRKRAPGRPRKSVALAAFPDASVVPAPTVRRAGGEPPTASAPVVRKRRGGPPKGSPAPLATGVALPVPPKSDETTLAVAKNWR
jgi:hypothetical protein